MSGELATAFVRIRAVTSQIKADVSEGIKEGTAAANAESDAGAAGSKAGSSYAKGFATAAKVGIGAAVAIGVASVDAAMKFDAQMTRIQTQAGASASQVRQLTTAVLKLAPSTEQGPQQLAEALYHLKSVGMDNVDAMRALKTASDLAAVGGANLEDTTNAIAAAWRSGIQGAQNFGDAAATVNAIIGAGNMTMSDFVTAMGTGILSAATTFGVSLKQVGGALALMTDEGVPAVDAATRLKMSFSLLAAPSKAAESQLKTIGLTGLQLANTMRSSGGLVATIALLKQHLDDSGLSASQAAILLSHAFGGGRSSSAILTMINNLNVLKNKQDQINSGVKKYGADVVAQRQTAEAQFHLLGSAVETIGIQIGNALIGPVTKFVEFLSGTAVPKVGALANGFLRLLGLEKTTQPGINTGSPQALTPALSSLISTTQTVHGLTGSNAPGISAATYTQAAARQATIQASKTGSQIVDSIITAMVKDAGKIGAALITMFGKINWQALGKEAATDLVPFAFSIISNLGAALINEAIHHPGDTIAVILALFPLGKLAEVLGTVFKGVPILGKLLTAISGPLEKAGKPIWTLIGKVLKFAFGDLGERLVGVAKGALDDAWTWLYTKGDDLMNGLLKGVKDFWSGTIVPWLKSLGSKILSPFARAGSWLLSKGSDAMSGLLSGVEKFWSGTVLPWLKGIGGKVLAPFAKAGTWLLDAGKKIIGGLITGITSKIGDVAKGIGSVVSKIKNFLPFSPAKEGPLSGAGDPYNSGVSIAKKIAAGLTAGAAAVKKAMTGIATTVTALAKESPSLLQSQIAALTKQQTAGATQLATGTSAVSKLKSERAAEEAQIKKLIAARAAEYKADGAASKALRAEQENQIKSLRNLRTAQESQIKTIDAAIKPLKSDLSKLRTELAKLTKAMAKQAAASTSSSSSSSSSSSGNSAAPADFGAFNQWMDATGPVDVTGASGGSWPGNPGPFGGAGLAPPRSPWRFDGGPPPFPGRFGGDPIGSGGQDEQRYHNVLMLQRLDRLIAVAKEQPQQTAAGLNAAMNGVVGRAIVRGGR